MPRNKTDNISFTSLNVPKWNYQEVNDALRGAQLIGASDNLLEEDETVVNSAFLTWCLGVKEMGVEELSKFAELPQKQQEELAKDFLLDLEAHDISSRQDRARSIENAKWYGQMCATAMSKIKAADIHFPTAEDLKDEKSRKAFQDPKFFLAAQIGRGFSRMTGNWRHVGNEIGLMSGQEVETPFLDKYSSAGDLVKDQNVLQYAAAVGSTFDTRLSVAKQAYLNTMAKDQWIPSVAGKSFAEVAETDTIQAGSMAFGKMQIIRAGGCYGFDRLSSKEQGMLLNGAPDQAAQHSEQASEQAYQKDKASALSDVVQAIGIMEKVKSEPLPEESAAVKAKETNNYWLDVDKLNAEDLDQAAELFDKFFRDMKAPQNKELVEGFHVDGRPVSEIIDSRLRGKEVTPEERVKYEKALVFLALRDPDARKTIAYRPYPFMMEDVRKFSSLSPEALDQAAELFDREFAGLKGAEQGAMAFNDKEDITGNFKIDGYPVEQLVGTMFDHYIKPSDKVKFEKAYILFVLTNPKQREKLTYEGFRVASYDDIVKKAQAGISADRWHMESAGMDERDKVLRPLVDNVLRTKLQGVPEALKKDGFSIGTDLGNLSTGDLEQAVQIFDVAFGKLKEAEQGALALYGKKEITDNFLYDGISVSSTVKAVLKDKNLSDEELIKYQKALIVHAMADPEQKKALSYETFRLYLGQNGYTVTATAQAESNDFTNVTEWRKQEAEQEARAYEEREEPKLFAQEADKYQMMNARILYAYRQRTGHWNSLSDIQTIRNALDFHFQLNKINESRYSFDYLEKNLPEKMKKDIEAAVNNMVAAEEAAEKAKQEERRIRQQAIAAESKLPRISDEQLAAIRTRVKQLEEKGINLAEYMDSSDHFEYITQLGGGYIAEISPFEIAAGSTRGTAYEEMLRKLPDKYYEETMKALKHVEELADKAKADPSKFDYADEKAEDLAYWFNRHEYSSIMQNSILDLKPVGERTNERGERYTVFELAKDLNKVKLDRDKLHGLDVQAMEEAQKLFNDNKEAFCKIFDIMDTRLHSGNGAVAAWARDRLNEIDKNEAGFDDPFLVKKLNQFRHLMYRIKVQDELVCKLGTDKNPVYVEPIDQLVDLRDEKVKVEECDILDRCYRDLKEPSERVSRNSDEYKDLMAAIKDLKETVLQDHVTSKEAREAYAQGIERVLNLANQYYVHKADDGVKNDATLEKIIAVERVSKTLKTRYKCITGKEFTDNISKEASLFGEPKQAKEELTGDQYVLGTAGGKIDQMKQHIREIKVAAGKDRAEFLKKTRKEISGEMADARKKAKEQYSRRNSIGALQGEKEEAKKLKSDNKPVRRNSVR
ncbi:MAG: hypothetical protein IJ147_02485 [Lachnospiraceae bacterium]|nr:hypothetical protein [Lachnospiraceae bacterium]